MLLQAVVFWVRKKGGSRKENIKGKQVKGIYSRSEVKYVICLDYKKQMER
jgi:hypothetical protein